MKPPDRECQTLGLLVERRTLLHLVTRASAFWESSFGHERLNAVFIFSDGECVTEDKLR